MSGNQEFVGQQPITAMQSDAAALGFVAQIATERMGTSIPVKVMAVTGGGVNAPPPRVQVQPMVHQVDGTGAATPHGVINNVPVHRPQVGTTALIMDPKVGDVGLLVVAHRDISTVKTTGDLSNPGSFRKNDLADGLYIGGFIGDVAGGSGPTQYIQATDDGFVIKATASISGTVDGDTFVLDAFKFAAVIGGSSFTLDSSGLHVQGTLTVDGGDIINNGTVVVVP